MDLTSNKTHTLDTITPQPTTKSLSFTNGTLKRHPTAAPPPSMAVISYKECLKNHAATIGGHALDGCGEFMPSSSTNPADPRSLKCAACGCHRNFHRREPPEPSTTTTPPQNPNFINCFYSPTSPTTNTAPPPPPPPPPQPLSHRGMSQSTSPSLSSSPSQSPSPMSSPSSPPPLSHVPPYHHHSSAAPHMLLALGTAYSAPPPPQQNSDHNQEHHYRSVFTNNNNSSGGGGGNSSSNKKRYRTKFSQEQKEKMLSFSEKLGWRMNKSDDVAVQEFCNDIGVPRGVFKVWMHNNKNSFKIKRSDAPNYNNAPLHNMTDDGNDSNNRVAGGGFNSDINNPFNTPPTTTANGCSDDNNNNNVHVPIDGLST